KIVEYMRNRVAKLQESHHLVIDGTLKSDESTVNSLSNYSRKARTKGTKDISVLYAYDVETREPVCSKIYPGNMLDIVAFKDFLNTNRISKGLIIADKGFTVKAANQVFADNPELHYLLPLKRDAALIDHYGMYQFEMSLDGNPQIVCRKAKINNERKWLYSFRDASQAANEEYAYLQKNKDDYDPKDHEARREEFGTIVFESDYDCPCELIYKAYEERWLIEMVFRYYKDVNEFDETRVHSDYSVISSEFVCFLSSIISSRILKRFDSAKSLDNLSYGKSMAVLERAKKVRIDGKWNLVRLTVKDSEILTDLGLIPDIITVKNLRGRPRKSKPRSWYSYTIWESLI
ncbi:MAG: transposase, partial [Candidatus Methanomethylophilaceae archaeon]|nr:transposase [Candidatus Methanomethylophilaceae archaeon]